MGGGSHEGAKPVPLLGASLATSRPQQSSSPAASSFFSPCWAAEGLGGLERSLGRGPVPSGLLRALRGKSAGVRGLAPRNAPEGREGRGGAGDSGARLAPTAGCPFAGQAILCWAQRPSSRPLPPRPAQRAGWLAAPGYRRNAAARLLPSRRLSRASCAERWPALGGGGGALYLGG